MSEDFSKNLIKEYKYWEVYIGANQNYLGRCVVWCKRSDAFDLADATIEEQQELSLILPKLREASKKLFQGDWFNYLFLGNQTPHLHGHFLPRYKEPRTFMNIIFKDDLYGYYPDDRDEHNVTLPAEVLAAMRDAMAEALK